MAANLCETRPVARPKREPLLDGWRIDAQPWGTRYTWRHPDGAVACHRGLADQIEVDAIHDEGKAPIGTSVACFKSRFLDAQGRGAVARLFKFLGVEG